MYRPDHSAHTGATAHRDDRVQFVVTGDETSLAELQSELALLPLCAKGRVFVEVPEPADVFPLQVPMRMTVTWLPRSVRGGRTGTGERCAPGQALRRAVGAWSAEMLCDGPGDTQAILTGDYRGVSGVYEVLAGRVGMTPENITAPERFGLRIEP
ncbi:SIP domain-containing protein [Planctomonas sp. JC2975]|uniref:SIP domain-containing protein n=1 Tax=Planctomonas sp. JC2975 TaxID=2729626 RepID=UPI0014733605|nr:SIP domain-containing protein [Planctomonas sp. JC2975]NNC13160.1 SIP domain-containing protein [Planctomonas sp. JC2975]